MRYRIIDKRYRFQSAFDTETGAYVRTGILDDNGRDTGVDPFMASYPHLIDVGIMDIVFTAKQDSAPKRASAAIRAACWWKNRICLWKIFGGSQSSPKESAISSHWAAGETPISTSILKRS